MKFLDTNIFIRYLAWDDPVKGEASKAFFEKLLLGDDEVLSSESVVAEILYVLTSSRHYGLSRSEAIERLQPALVAQGLRFADKRAILRAVEVYSDYSFLDFEDALSVAHMEAARINEIMSYDRGFDRVEGIVRVEP